MNEYHVIGKRLPRIDAKEKVKGLAHYTDDLKLPGMLCGMILRSPFAHARILKIDASRALKVPGVKAVITGEDTVKVKYGVISRSPKFVDEYPLAVDRIRFIGEEVAAVAATDPDAALEAIELVQVEYEALPAVFDPELALQPGAPQIHDHAPGNISREFHLKQGDVEKGFFQSDFVREDTFTTQSAIHAYLEPHAALAAWDSDTLVVRTATQYSHYHRAEIARTLGLPSERVRVIPTVVGGAFGGKTDISCQCLAALAAYRTGRPVKLVYSRAESFESTTKRHPYRIRCRSGATRDGDLTALQVDMLADTGAYASFGPGLMVKTFASATGPYRWPHVELHGRVVFTNNPTAGCMRSIRKAASSALRPGHRTIRIPWRWIR